MDPWASAGPETTAAVPAPPILGKAVLVVDDGRNVYVLRTGSGGATTVQSSSVYGTLVVEGNALGCGGNSDFELKNNGRIYTLTTNTTHGQSVTAIRSPC